MKILVLEDEHFFRGELCSRLEAEGHSAIEAQDIVTANAHLAQSELVIADLRVPLDFGSSDPRANSPQTRGGLEFIASVRNKPVIVMTNHSSFVDALRHVARGQALAWVNKDVEGSNTLTRICEKVRAFAGHNDALGEIRRRQRALGPGDAQQPCQLVGASDALCRLLLEMERIAVVLARGAGRIHRSNILIEGETGVGKEVVARALHQAVCPSEPFVAFNCATMPETLIDTVLFGAARLGGGIQTRPGLLEDAGAGVLFLDEVGSMPISTQEKLLSVLGSRQFSRIGSSRAEPFRATLISASNVPLQDRVNEGALREDLRQRLSTLQVCVPPLRKRLDDIPALVARTLARCGFSECALSPYAADALAAYAYPGNVRELENIVLSAVAAAAPELFIDLEHLPRYIFGQAPVAAQAHATDAEDFWHPPRDPRSYSAELEEFRRWYWMWLFGFCGGDGAKMVAISGYSRQDVHRRCQPLQLSPSW